MLCACASVVRSGEKVTVGKNVVHPHPENDVGAVVQQQLVQLRDVRHGRLVRVVKDAAIDEPIDAGHGVLSVVARFDL